MRSTIFLMTGLAGLTGMTLAACGDDSGGTPIDAPTGSDGSGSGSDAANPDAPVHVFKGFDADEGGEVRLEYLKFGNGNVGARGTAYVYKNPGTPAYHDFINQMGMCIDTHDHVANPVWPIAQNADREYFDVGPEIDILGTGMSPYRLPVRNDTTTKDPFGRGHTGPWYFDPSGSTENDGASYLSAATTYDVAFPGSSEFPAQYFDNAVYIPADFALTNATPVVIQASGNTDQTFTWDVATETPPAGVEVLSLVAFSGPNGPAVTCIEPNDGSITVPGAMLDIVAAVYGNAPDPTKLSMARQTLTHQVRELYDANGPTGRRIDFIGVWCYARGYTVAPAP